MNVAPKLIKSLTLGIWPSVAKWQQFKLDVQHNFSLNWIVDFFVKKVDAVCNRNREKEDQSEESDERLRNEKARQQRPVAPPELPRQNTSIQD